MAGLKLTDPFACIKIGPWDRPLETFVGNGPLVHTSEPIAPLIAGHANQRSWKMSGWLTAKSRHAATVSEGPRVPVRSSSSRTGSL